MAEQRGRAEKMDRKARIPLGTLRRKLSLSHDKEADMKARGVVPRWINDRGDRLREAMEGGYEFERDTSVAASIGDAPAGTDISANGGTDTRIRRRVGEDGNGNPIFAYLMSVPKDIFDEDFNEKMRQIDEQEKGMLHGKDKDGKPIPGTYVPTTGDGPPKMEVSNRIK